LLAVFLAMPLVRLRAADSAKDYSLPDVGALRLAVPGAWQDSFNKTIQFGTRVDELRFQPRDGNSNAFGVVLNVFHMSRASAGEFDTKSTLLEAVKKELPDPSEKSPEVQTLKGAEVTGSYVSLTDAGVSATDPKPGEYKYLTQGYAKLGTLVLGFRIVSNRANGDEKSLALNMIKSARLLPPK
jgi:hypothetical protein